MGNLAEDHERNIRNIENSALVRTVRVKAKKELLKVGTNSIRDYICAEGHPGCFVLPSMSGLCGEVVQIDINGFEQTTGEEWLLYPWMYEELEVPDPRADERLQQNEEHQRKKVDPRLGPCLSCGGIKVLDMEGSRTINVHHDYRKLCDVLVAALDQAQSGKGRERHAAGEPFEQQEICQNTRAVGYGYPLGQARKKARESLRLLEDRGPDAAIAECLGAINYLAAAVVVMQEKGGEA